MGISNLHKCIIKRKQWNHFIDNINNYSNGYLFKYDLLVEEKVFIIQFNILWWT